MANDEFISFHARSRAHLAREISVKSFTDPRAAKIWRPDAGGVKPPVADRTRHAYRQLESERKHVYD